MCRTTILQGWKVLKSKLSLERIANTFNPLTCFSPHSRGTSHVVAADATGMAVTLTSTVNRHFGSQLMIPETGIIMNNEMNDFSIPNTTNAFGYIPSPYNFIRPGKRPLSSISPVIVEYLANSTLYFVVGAAGGSRIITAAIQTLWHVLDHNFTTHKALSEPRLHDQLTPNRVQFEYAYDNGTVAFMEGRGHSVTWIPLAQSAVHALRRLPNGTFEAAGDPRMHASAGYAV